ncbi:MAG: MBL fold metallo-hydrolase [Ketobacteraceae bacterium]|nr:MBL fold metallo-hydrolase [Ketobacteraceae bacterium]
MIFRQLFDFETYTYTYLLADEQSREALLIDTVKDNTNQYQTLLKQLDLSLKVVLDTHVHADHITAAGDLRDLYGCETVLSHQTAADCVSRRVVEGDTVQAGRVVLKVLETPGHTDDSLCYYLEGQPGMLFTGDTLLIRGTGRTDFQNGNPHDQYQSLFHKILRLPPETIVYPAHDYKGWTSSTLAEESAHNPRLQVEDESAYVDLMNNLNLDDPKFMDVAVPANLACGKNTD